MHDDELIDPARHRVWAVDVLVDYTAYVVAKSADEAERIAKGVAHDFDPVYLARELIEPLEPAHPDADAILYGRSRSEERVLTVNEAVELIASHKPVYDTQTALMPFADTPPPIHPRRAEDGAAGRWAR